MDNTFLVCSRNESDVEWLQSALVSVGQIVKVGDTLDEVLRLMDMMRASLIFIGVDRDNLVAQCALIEGLLEARPMLVVVAVGDGFNSELVIAAMRAGARDFITYGLRGSEVQGLVRRLATRLPQLPSRPEQGGLAVLHSARPDAEAALVAAHIALSCAANGSATLLLDLG
ncbi:MAG: pilus assembly protein, partial [Porticoccaceae bacterium]